MHTEVPLDVAHVTHTHLTELPGSFVKDLILCVGADGQVTTLPPPPLAVPSH